MSTSRSRAWKISFFITPEGVCGIELENVWRNAGARCTCGAAQRDSTLSADISTAAAIRLYLRQGHGGKRVYASGVQESVGAWHHRHQHGLHRDLGGHNAAYRRISMDAGNRRSPAGAD